MKPIFVQWGAGNIGRSFIGQLFARGGYTVVFIDVNEPLIKALNESHAYTITSVSQEESFEMIIENVSAINASNQEEINKAISSTQIMGVSVGKNIWPRIAKSLSQAIEARHKIHPYTPIDIILAENIHRCAQFVSQLLLEHLPQDFPFDSYVGLIETSIGKMVPLQDIETPLILRSEPYNELIVNKDGFLNPIPHLETLNPVHPIEAYVERKLFIHNLGHAAASYLGYKTDPESIYISQVLENKSTLESVKKAMEQSAEVLINMYPQVFTHEQLLSHIEDLIHRFQNPFLLDTVFRVGRDVKRKLRFDDRLMGIIIEAQKRDLNWDYIGKVYLCGLSFRATDKDGTMLNSDKELFLSFKGKSLEEIIFIASEWEMSSHSNELFHQIVNRLSKIEH